MDEESFLRIPLEKRKEEGCFRELKHYSGLIDFCSNDYLGMATRGLLLRTPGDGDDARTRSSGSRGSRLLAGNYPEMEEAENQIAGFHDAESGLIFNSGYDANLGLFSSVPRKGDTIFFDQLIHASIRDGIRLSQAAHFSFRHNDMADLSKKLHQGGSGRRFVAVESVYSMDGDLAPLKEIAEICTHTGTLLIVDEAHATGILGPKGEGRVQELGLQTRCFARMHTFSKALGAHGAIILGSRILRDYLINFSRPFIYSTALPPASLACIQNAYACFPGMQGEREHLQELIAAFQQNAPVGWLGGGMPIQIVRIPGNDRAKAAANTLCQGGFDVRAILHPTVPRGAERLRIVLHAYNTRGQVGDLITLLNNC
ncbi:MAG TPA: 8-amino-7-oxononanoate synthase [Chitinophagaceae bacterium]|nr:8-amino-7-oxononanoate synthase [Chitinophagaceae bacterium]